MRTPELQAAIDRIESMLAVLEKDALALLGMAELMRRQLRIIVASLPEENA